MASNSNMQAALDEAGKVIKKQKLSASKVSDCLDKLLQLAQQSRQQLAAGSNDAIQQLQAQAEQLGLVKEMNNSTKELHSSINKLSKVRTPATMQPSCYTYAKHRGSCVPATTAPPGQQIPAPANTRLASTAAVHFSNSFPGPRQEASVVMCTRFRHQP